jgi:ABC-type Na+ efflux pump permease subunit
LGDPRFAIARRELSTLRTEKTIVLALLIQLFIAAFSSFLVVGLVSLYDPASVDGYEVQVAVTGDATEDLLAVTDDREALRGVPYPNEAQAMSAFGEGRVDAVLVTEEVDDRIEVTAVAPDGNVRTTLAVVQLRETLQAFERLERDQRSGSLSSTPLSLPPAGETSPYFGFTYTVLIPLLCFLPVFIGGSIAVDSVAEEFERGTLELLRVAPLDVVDVVDGKVWAAAALVPAQAGLWLLLLSLNGTRIAAPLALVALVAAVGVGVVAIGAFVALFAPERRTAQLLYSMAILVGFGATALFPQSPVNAAARLAIGSADGVTRAAVVGYAAVGVGAYLLVRRLARRTDVA